MTSQHELKTGQKAQRRSVGQPHPAGLCDGPSLQLEVPPWGHGSCEQRPAPSPRPATAPAAPVTRKLLSLAVIAQTGPPAAPHQASWLLESRRIQTHVKTAWLGPSRLSGQEPLTTEGWWLLWALLSQPSRLTVRVGEP